MPASASLESVTGANFLPLDGLIAASPYRRPCGAVSYEQWLHLGLQRVLESGRSGRAFLQEHALRWGEHPGHSTYFAALHSERRRYLIRDVQSSVLTRALLPNRLELPELERYGVLPGGGGLA